jgi:hypothetical protein
MTLLKKKDMNDIDVALKDLGITLDQLTMFCDFGIDIDMPLKNIEVKKSPIHGKGVFATQTIKPLTLIGQVFFNRLYKTHLGRYTNHSLTPNIIFVYVEEEGWEWCDNVIALSINTIKKNEEILVDYRAYITNPILLPRHLAPE